MSARDAVRRLAEGPDHRATVAAAAAATRDVERAAAFVSGDGLARLDRAIAAAERADDPAAVRAGRAIRDALTAPSRSSARARSHASGSSPPDSRSVSSRPRNGFTRRR